MRFAVTNSRARRTSLNHFEPFLNSVSIPCENECKHLRGQELRPEPPAPPAVTSRDSIASQHLYFQRLASPIRRQNHPVCKTGRRRARRAPFCTIAPHFRVFFRAPFCLFSHSDDARTRRAESLATPFIALIARAISLMVVVREKRTYTKLQRRRSRIIPCKPPSGDLPVAVGADLATGAGFAQELAVGGVGVRHARVVIC
jgi:hypothetical protein